MAEKLKVFVAHSFDQEAPVGENMSDMDVAKWFINLMKKKPLQYTVVTGSKPAPRPIDEKIKRDIADCSCVVGIYTKRYYDTNLQKWLPSQFVLCECACAIGFYYHTTKLICGFYEEGIEPRDLALITIGGLELIPFKRGDLEKNKSKFVDYLGRIPNVVATGGEFELFGMPPYSQQNLRKIYTVYKNGNVHVQNINKMLITDSKQFNDENKGQITHEIWHKRVNIPPPKRYAQALYG
ncbi:MAG: hypothetical protein KAV87_11360 [Desulfobacteraceae bacterium]|nr:hypothetical protein [Desulfobacteraceae bacterium]